MALVAVPDEPGHPGQRKKSHGGPNLQHGRFPFPAQHGYGKRGRSLELSGPHGCDYAAYGLAQRGICVISGLAYGIDAHAHRAALAGTRGSGPATIAVLAGGLDRDYPSGNADLAAAIRTNGLTLSELPPGTAPTRYRFLQRNRIIAALAGVTCVVEGRWRSAALNTAHHAETIARHVAAVPGSVPNANSAGCHWLLKEGGAVLVSGAAELSELLAS